MIDPQDMTVQDPTMTPRAPTIQNAPTVQVSGRLENIDPAPIAALRIGDHAKSQRTPLLVELVGVKYWVIPPKMRSAIRMFAGLQQATSADSSDEASLTQYDTWISKIFRDQAPGVIARLDDDNDDLDLVHINQLTQQLIERATGGDPTMSLSAS
jgi:hypothetical protein